MAFLFIVYHDLGTTKKFKSGSRLLHKSKTISKDLNPVFDEIFVVPIEDPFQPIKIKVNILWKVFFRTQIFLFLPGFRL